VSALRAWAWRVLGTWGSSRRERELADELESHLQMHIDDNVRAGMPPEEARRQALLKLGGVEQTKEAWRERAGFPQVGQTLSDLRFALRQLVKSPGFAATAVFVLALGIGASTALFAFVDAALVRPLPYRDPARLVSVNESPADTPQRRTPLSYLDYVDWKRLGQGLASLDVFTGAGYMLSTPAGAEAVPAARVSAGFFRTLGVTPLLGRDFQPGDDAPGAPAIVMLTYGAWQKRFGGRADVIGRTATLSGVPHVVVGVLPQGFQFALRGRAELWTPLLPTGGCEQQRSCHNLRGIGRLRAGVPAAAVDAEMKGIASELERRFPESNRDQSASVVLLSEEVVGEIRPILLMLLGGAALLLVIAAVNVASLLLLRSESRKREVAVRGALGASRARLVRQFATEGLVLATLGATLGLAFAAAAMRLLLPLIPAEMMSRMPYLQGLGLGSHVVLFAGAVSLLSVCLFSLVPLLRLPSGPIRQGLTEGARGASGTAWRRFGGNLVVVELAVAVVLLAGAGLLGRSFYRMSRVDLGFQPERLATLLVAAPPARYPNGPATAALARRVSDELESLPGVESVGLTSVLPVSFNGNTDWIRFVGRPFGGEHNEVNQRDVSGAYLATLRAKLLRGRFFGDDDDASKPRVAVVNQALVRKYFPDEDPVGQRFGDIGLSPGSIKEIVGVVADVRESQLDVETWPTVYYPFGQSPNTEFSVVARTAPAPASLLPVLRAAVRRIDPELGVVDEVTMEDHIADSPAAYLRRSGAALIGGFAACALLLAVVGLYGVVAYSVSGREREIGVRMALGAQRWSVYQLVLGEAGRLVGVGMALGLASSIGAASLASKLLFETAPWDVPTLATVAATLAASAMLAGYIPARRAASVDPIVALRAE
jgi:macrolide transport system ATP-binding/permease protein